jgi:P2-related tail formation protein
VVAAAAQGAPHTFEAVMTIANQDGQSATAMFVEDVIGEITRTKPVRSHFTFTRACRPTPPSAHLQPPTPRPSAAFN